MTCPHCRVVIHAPSATVSLGADAEGGWLLTVQTCPACRRFILSLMNGEPILNSRQEVTSIKEPVKRIVPAWPKAASRPPAPPEIPSQLAEDYREACLVLAESPKASAALSRR